MINTILDQTDMEKPRTPSQLRLYVTSLLEQIGRNEEAKKLGRLRKGLSKYLIREMLPLSVFSVWKYPQDGVLCVPQIGNQGHDAIITDLNARQLIQVEITWPVDGQHENYHARSLNERGHTDVEVGDTEEGRAAVKARILEGAHAKARIDYGSAALLVVMDLWPEFFLDQPGAQAEVNDLIARLQCLHYKAGAVYLLLFPTEYVVRLGIAPVVEVKDCGHPRGPVLSTCLDAG